MGDRAGEQHRGLCDPEDGDGRDLARGSEAGIAEARDDDAVERVSALANRLERRERGQRLLVVALDRTRAPRRADRLDLRAGPRVAPSLLADVAGHLLTRVRVDDEDAHLTPLRRAYA